MKMIVKLTYFKEYGKYYTEGEFEMEDSPMFKACEMVTEMEEGNCLPGLSGGKWSGHILVYSDSEKYAVPCLMLKENRSK